MEPTQPVPPPQYDRSNSFGLSPELPETPPPSKDDGWRSVLSTLAILIAAPVVAVALTAYVFQSYEVDGPSMETTLQHKDRLLVLKLPRTIARVTGDPFIPNRGDVIIFNTSQVQDGLTKNGQKQLIKRVVAIPGDRVVVHDGSVTIFNDEYPTGFNPDKTYEYGKAITATPGEVDTVVGEGEVFVLGDNRTNSTDSRMLGTVPSDDIIGKLILRIYPLNNAEVF